MFSYSNVDFYIELFHLIVPNPIIRAYIVKFNDVTVKSNYSKQLTYTTQKRDKVIQPTELAAIHGTNKKKCLHINVSVFLWVRFTQLYSSDKGTTNIRAAGSL